MYRYNPLITPDPHAWLELEEFDRVGLVHSWHDEFADEVPEGNEMLHANIHVMVENQLAKGDLTVTDALSRLLEQGLNRHEAIHAIGSVLAKDIYEQNQGVLPEASYHRHLKGLFPEGWC